MKAKAEKQFRIKQPDLQQVKAKMEEQVLLIDELETLLHLIDETEWQALKKHNAKVCVSNQIADIEDEIHRLNLIIKFYQEARA